MSEILLTNSVLRNRVRYVMLQPVHQHTAESHFPLSKDLSLVCPSARKFIYPHHRIDPPPQPPPSAQTTFSQQLYISTKWVVDVGQCFLTTHKPTCDICAHARITTQYYTYIAQVFIQMGTYNTCKQFEFLYRGYKHRKRLRRGPRRRRSTLCSTVANAPYMPTNIYCAKGWVVGVAMYNTWARFMYVCTDHSTFARMVHKMRGKYVLIRGGAEAEVYG